MAFGTREIEIFQPKHKQKTNKNDLHELLSNKKLPFDENNGERKLNI